jgi:Tfp pilus assembly protein PilF
MFLAALHIPQLHICINASISTKKMVELYFGLLFRTCHSDNNESKEEKRSQRKKTKVEVCIEIFGLQEKLSC